MQVLLDKFKQCAGNSDQRRGAKDMEEVRSYAQSFADTLGLLGLAQVDVRDSGQSAVVVSARTPLTGPNKDHSVSVSFHWVPAKDGVAITYSNVANGRPSSAEHMRWSERGELRLIPLVTDWAMAHGGPAVREKLQQPASRAGSEGFGWGGPA